MPINAIVEQPQGSDNRRDAARWRIRLELPDALDADAPDDARGNVVIHDISTAGMLVETRSNLKIGQSVMLSLPDAEKVVARIVWQNESLFGCRFDQALPQGVVSAVRLRNPDQDKGKPLGDPAQAPNSEEISEGLPERLRRLRRERGLSRAALSEQTGFSKPTLWGWETGRTKPRRDNLLVLAALFGLSEQQLLFGKGDSPPREVRKAGPEAYAQSLRDIIDLSRARIAEAAGVHKSNVRVTIDF
ncbi:helix-turn-helix domain-containing protein [Sphingobium sp. JS3065]|jgi:transcriptional regulator with XRE-family HTH domain|uniref:helix-turn-helix domain-containing protein n=1 Tax=Sphingobium sp. JS3065 TaxID=2970925 RepID=UPI00226555EC|nr:helix-turn-helix domain-containing protein [Sphingobium sp. JS3065]UZW57142.1 helix-turn-helix domain-containing protein [Sphingobium sp. JS3065]